MNVLSIDQLCVNTVRFLAVDAVEKAQSGHPGTPMEAAPLAYLLWTRFLRHNPRNPRWINRDRFILSAGHASMLLYSLLHLTGYDLSLDDLKSFRQWGSRTPGHPEFGHTAGVETTTGPLGQGFATGVGMAIGQRRLAALHNRPGAAPIDYNIYSFVSDGDIMEGVASEAASLAGHLRLGTLKYVYLDNHITIDGDTALTFSEDVGKRFEAYGWGVARLPDVNDLGQAEAALKELSQPSDRPRLLIARTHIGFGSPNKQDTAEAHGSPLGADEVRLTKEALGWPLEPTFYVPPEVREVCQQALSRGEKLEAVWRSAHSARAREIEKQLQGPLPDVWEKHLPAFKAGTAVATRQASGTVINALAPVIQALVGGSADLAPSNNTLIKDSPDFSVAHPEGRNLRFGVREHAMGAILNGLALTPGVLPYGGTFLIFTDYMRPAIRLAALMKLGVIYVMTHDSVGLGEDGPTHQPVEQLAALRAVPNLWVIRPADAAETAQAWAAAIRRRDGPTLLALTRQKLPVLDRSKLASADHLHKGAYVLSPAPGGKPQIILIATGSEVHVALAAQDQLAVQGVPASVVSAPCLELFRAQSAIYQDEVLPPTLRARVVVEAGTSFGWHALAGPQAAFVTIDHFGASAPGDAILEKYGFTAHNVVKQALTLLNR